MCQDCHLPAPGTDRKRHGLPDDPTFDDNQLALALMGIDNALSGLLKMIPFIGSALAFFMGKAVGAYKDGLDGKVNLYLRVVSDQMYDRFTRMTTFMNVGFKQLTQEIVELDYSQKIYRPTVYFQEKFEAIMKYGKDEKSTDEERAQVAKDFLDVCNNSTHQPIDVLYALYRRISKSSMDLNFIWTAIRKYDYHADVFEPWKEHVKHTAGVLFLCHIMYVALQYKKEREDNKSTGDDNKEIERVFLLMRQIYECLDKIDEDRKQLYFPRMAEQFMNEELGKGYSETLEPEDRILFKLKSHFPWHEFLLIRWTSLNTSGGETQQWKSGPENLKFFEKEVRGVVYRIIRVENGIGGDLYGNLSYMNRKFNDDAVNNYDQGANYYAGIESVLSELRNTENFKNPHWFVFALEYTSGNSKKGNLDKQNFMFKSTSGYHFAHQSIDIYGDRQKTKFITNHQVFLANVATD